MSLKTLLAVAFAFVLLFGGWFFVTYNGLVSAQEAVDARWYQVENQYQRRADLIPNLVETVKGIVAHEEKTFTELAKYRTQWNAATTQEEKIEAAKGLDTARLKLQVIVENYPQLKSNENFLALQAQLEGTENRVAVERMRYNEKVRDYNTQIKRMPSSIVANMYGFRSKLYFEAERGAEEVPDVKFGTPTTPIATTPQTTTSIPSASVELYGEKTDVDIGEDIILKLSAVNLITKPQMTLQVILIPPSGMSVTSSDFVTSGAGQYTSTYKLEPGGARDIEVRIKTSQAGDFKVKGRIVYYYGDDKNSTAEDHTLELPIKVRAKKPING